MLIADTWNEYPENYIVVYEFVVLMYIFWLQDIGEEEEESSEEEEEEEEVKPKKRRRVQIEYEKEVETSDKTAELLNKF